MINILILLGFLVSTNTVLAKINDYDMINLNKCVRNNKKNFKNLPKRDVISYCLGRKDGTDNLFRSFCKMGFLNKGIRQSKQACEAELKKADVHGALKTCMEGSPMVEECNRIMYKGEAI